MIDKLKVLIGGFLAILIGIVLLGVVADNVHTTSQINNALNESLTMAGPLTASTGSTTYSNITAVNYFANATDDLTANLDTLVNWTSSGTITVGGGLSNVSNSGYNISYEYEHPNYIANGTSRTLISLITLFFALGILALGIALVYASIKEFI